MSNDKKLKEFCKNYQAIVKEGDVRYRKPLVNMDPYEEPVWMQATYETVGSVQITMPVYLFEAFLETEAKLKQLMNSSAYVNYHPGDALWEAYIKEERLRKAYPSLQIAYDKYTNLLSLVDSSFND